MRRGGVSEREGVEELAKPSESSACLYLSVYLFVCQLRLLNEICKLPKSML